MTICAIHQPNFFPWAGFFDKIRQADIFIFLDDVAYPKSGSGAGSWCNRVQLLSSGEPDWYGLPIKREAGVQLIQDVHFLNQSHVLKKMKKKLEHNYKKYPYFSETMAILEPLLLHNETNLAAYNIHSIVTLSKTLGFKTKFIKQSELKHSRQSNELLIELIQQVGADSYLCGNGASGYQNDTLFLEAGIQLVYQDTSTIRNTFVQDESNDALSLSIVHHLMTSYPRLQM
ncbi:WbqC family protein [bacterium]|nr:WbqC family protein [bacterium]